MLQRKKIRYVGPSRECKRGAAGRRATAGSSSADAENKEIA
jgi:hypothetical protein